MRKVVKNAAADAKVLHGFCEDLFPICRSLTGKGVRETLARMQNIIPLEVCSVPSGKTAFDWEVPNEWNLNEAYIENSRGERVIDTANNNLHVVNYSNPVERKCTRDELEKHLFTIPNRPDWIPYRTAYYADTWGFCLSENQRKQLSDPEYFVKIDTTLQTGELNYGEYFIRGRCDREILVSAHICHPSMVNDNLSGMSVATYLARYFSDKDLEFGLRFVFAPATIGAITWLSENRSKLDNIRDGLVISGVGDPGPFTYKESKHSRGVIDRLFHRTLDGTKHTIRSFLPYGYDERQYCSPGINIAMGCLMRTPYGEYPEYHTSADNLDFVQPDKLKESLDLCISVIEQAQRDVRYQNTSPMCEPQLGKRGLYEPIGGNLEFEKIQLAQFWLLSYSDGDHSLLDIQDLSEIDSETLDIAAQRLEETGLLQRCD